MTQRHSADYRPLVARSETRRTRAALDGNFDDDEKPDLRVVGRRMVARGMLLAAVA